MTKGRFKFCCPALEMACTRASDNQRTGIQTGSMFQARGKRGSFRTAVVIYFPKAKKGDESKYGFKSEFKNTTYGLCRFCPFCGFELEKDKTAPRPSGESDGGVAGRGAEPSTVQPAE